MILDPVSLLVAQISARLVGLSPGQLQSSEMYLNSLLVLLPDEVCVVLALLGLLDVVEVVDPQVHRQGDRLKI
jgi:hypothetical protein